MPYFCYLIGLFLLCSCGGKATKPREHTGTRVATPGRQEVKYVNSLRLISPEKNQLYSFGDELSVDFENKDRFPVDSSIVYLNGQVIAKLNQDTGHYIYRIPAGKSGTATVKVVAYHPGNKQGIVSARIRIKPDKAPEKCSYEVIRTYAHDPHAYTQGLLYQDGYMYEGTGQYGESSVRKIDLTTGNILAELSIDNQLFGEGITIYKDKIYQITWRSRKGFIYDLKTFTLESSFGYPSEGWGLTTAGDHLIMSDGSNKLYHINPSSFNIIKETEVYDHQGEVAQLNELEYVDGLVWANIWLTDRIVAINPETGTVEKEMDMSGLLTTADKAGLNDKDDVLNGIAYNPAARTFYVTGKRWPKLFEIRVSCTGTK